MNSRDSSCSYRRHAFLFLGATVLVDIPAHLKPYTTYLLRLGNIELSLAFHMVYDPYMVSETQAFEDMDQAVSL